MDFSNEPYVRIYTTITPTARSWGFFGRCLMDALIRHADRAGVIELQGELCDLSVEIAVAVAIDCPEVSWVEQHLPALLRTDSVRVVKHEGAAYLFLPRYFEAQTATQSKEQSNRNYGAKRRARDRAVQIGLLAPEDEATSA